MKTAAEWAEAWERECLAIASLEITEDEPDGGLSSQDMKSVITSIVLRAMEDAARDMRERCAAILEGDYIRPVATPWRDDGKPSKHDKCPHGQWGYEDCEECAVAAVRALPLLPEEQKAPTS